MSLARYSDSLLASGRLSGQMDNFWAFKDLAGQFGRTIPAGHSRAIETQGLIQGSAIRFDLDLPTDSERVPFAAAESGLAVGICRDGYSHAQNQATARFGSAQSGKWASISGLPAAGMRRKIPQ